MSNYQGYSRMITKKEAIESYNYVLSELNKIENLNDISKENLKKMEKWN